MILQWLTMVLLECVIHPIHVSITDVELDRERNALEFTTRVFLDDLEKKFRQEQNDPYFDLTDPEQGKSVDDLIVPYFNKIISISVNGKKRTVEYLGSEIEEDAVYLYYQVTAVRKLKVLMVESRILTDLFDDQVNMLHFKTESGELRSLKTTKTDPVGSIAFDI